MNRRGMITTVGAAAMCAAMPAQAADAGLTVALSLPDSVTNGVATTPEGRVFAAIARIDGTGGARVVEMSEGKPVPYPNLAWNAYAEGVDATRTLVWVNSLRIGPDGDLWLVDTGMPGFGAPRLPGGTKLVQIDVAADRVRRTIPLDAMLAEKSFVDDVRFDGARAYLSDAGAPALIVLDLATGRGRRMLEGHASVTAHRPISAEGRIVRGPDGKPVFVHADQIEVSPDGAWLYYQACSGPLYRVPTKLLGDSGTGAAQLAGAVELVADTPPTGGTAMAADGTIFVSDTDTQRIVRVAPDGTMSTLVHDPRLLWVDAMWLDRHGRLWMPAAQLNRLAVFQAGISRVRFPAEVYTLDVDARPSPNDHP